MLENNTENLKIKNDDLESKVNFLEKKNTESEKMKNKLNKEILEIQKMNLNNKNLQKKLNAKIDLIKKILKENNIINKKKFDNKISSDETISKEEENLNIVKKHKIKKTLKKNEDLKKEMIKNDTYIKNILVAIFKEDYLSVDILSEKIDLKKKLQNGKTPLKHAFDSLKYRSVLTLLQNGADEKEIINSIYDFISIVDFNFCEDFICIEIIDLLLKREFDVNFVNTENGENSLMLAIKLDKIDIAEFLIFKKCDLNILNKQGQAALYLACEKGLLDLVKIIIKNKCNLNNTEEVIKYDPLIIACQKGYFDIVKVLVENKFVLDNINESKINALSCASNGGFFEIVKLLVENGCRTGFDNKELANPLCVSLARKITKKGDKIFMEILFYLIEKGTNYNNVDGNGYNCLYYAIQNDVYEEVEFLVCNGININNDVILEKIFDKSNERVLSLLIKQGLPIIYKTTNTKNLYLFRAIENGSVEMVKYLIKNGANKDYQEYTRFNNASKYNNYNFLGYAIAKRNKNYIEIIDFLLKIGCDKNNILSGSKKKEACSYYSKLVPGEINQLSNLK